MRNHRKWMRTGIAIAGVLLSCSPTPQAPEAADAKPAIYAVNYPLAYFAERIGGDLVDVHFPAPADVDPAYWEPDTATIEAYQSADLILRNGAGYAAWVDKASLSPSKLVDTSAAFADRYIEIEDAVTHSHGPGGEHSHASTAFTTWLDPALAELHAAAVRDAIKRLLPNQAPALVQGFAALAADLQALDADLASAFEGRENQPLLASHPVYQYLARRYRLNLESVHWEPDEMPAEEEWSALSKLLKQHRAKRMIWEGAPDPAISARLEKLGIEPVVFSPCANRPETGDYLQTMRRNAAAWRAIYRAAADFKPAVSENGKK